MLIRIIRSYRDIVAVCDSDLLGKKFEEGEFQLDIKESFFSGENTSEEEAIKIMRSMAKEDATFNIIGKKSVEVALKAGIIDSDAVKKVQGIPFALVLM